MEPVNKTIDIFNTENLDYIQELNDLIDKNKGITVDPDIALKHRVTALLIAGKNKHALKLIDDTLPTPSPSITPPSSNHSGDTETMTDNSGCKLSLFNFTISCISNKTSKKKSKPKKVKK